MNRGAGASFVVPMPSMRTGMTAVAVLVTAIAAAACARPFPRDPEVVRWFETAAKDEAAVEWSADDLLGELTITAPEPLVQLIRRGADAVPTLLDMLPSVADGWPRRMLVEVLGRSGDPRAREPLERLLGAGERDVAETALEAVGRLGQPASIPALRALQSRPDHGGFGAAELLAAILRVGDDTMVEPLVDLGLAAAGSRSVAVDALVRHVPLRAALGMREVPRFLSDDDLFLRAAKEWLLERRGEPSPWKPAPSFRFAEPFAAEKQAAFALIKTAHRPQGGVRYVPVDVTTTGDVPELPVAVLYCWGHARGIGLDVWQPRGATVRLHRFGMVHGKAHSAFAGDTMQAEYAVAEVPAVVLQRVLAGMRAALAARVLAWWNGPELAVWWSSSDFGVVLSGIVAGDAAPSFCGYEDSYNLLRCAGLQAARDWHLRIVGETACESVPVGDDGRRLFCDQWRRCTAPWSDDSWWFVRERMVAMAGAFGDVSLVPDLRTFLDPRFAEGKDSAARTAANACTALAALTGVERRFEIDRAPRKVADAAQDYREVLDRR